MPGRGGSPKARANKKLHRQEVGNIEKSLAGQQAALDAIPSERRLHWQFSRLDWGCSWSWEHHSDGPELRITLESLARLEGKTMAQLRAEMGVGDAGRYLSPVRPSKLCPEAKRKWDDIQDGTGALLYHFRTDSHQKSRVWAAYIDPVMYLLWWDPQHLVMP